jgi:hypothetical protein
MDAESVLPKRLIAYIHDVGVRALDHLADTVEHNGSGGEGAVNKLVGHWRSMPEAEKQDFVNKVAAAVVEVVAASAMLPVGLKLGKKVAKKAGRVIKKRSKALRKSVKALSATPEKKLKKASV